MRKSVNYPERVNSATVIDLFSGAGGLTLGAIHAGFHVAVAVDYDSDLTSSFIRNFPTSRLLEADLSLTDWTQLKHSVDTGPIVGVIGGPPCQGISGMGLRDEGDLRNGLIVRFFSLVAQIMPIFFLMENVPQLATPRYSTLLEVALSRLPGHYRLLPPLILNAHDCGAPTSRKRLIISGYDPRYMDRLDENSLDISNRYPKMTVRDAISDVPEPIASDEMTALPYRSSVPISAYASRMRESPSRNLGSRKARIFHGNRSVNGNSRTVHSTAVSTRFSNVLPGKQDYVSRYSRLDWDKPAPVLRAGTGRDRGSYQAARPIHPEADRVISVREAARLQGFPDWFEFSHVKWHSHRMIGNSVSPLFASALLSAFRSRIG